MPCRRRCLALAVDGTLLLAERALRVGGRSRKPLAVAAGLALVALAAVAVVSALGSASRDAVIRVGSKNFTEQIILGELRRAADRSATTGLEVERRLNLGGTFICDRALRSGDIDVYVEYTGTADTAVFKNPVETDPARVLERVRQRYADGGLTLLPPLGFENTFAILVRGDEARRLRTEDDRGRRAAHAGLAGGVRLRIPAARRRLSRPVREVWPALRGGAPGPWTCRSSIAPWPRSRSTSSPATRPAA